MELLLQHLVIKKKDMKNILVIILTVALQSCYCQTIKPLSDASLHEDYGKQLIYFKDIANNFTPFLGSWKYTSGNTTFVVSLWKETKYVFRDNLDQNDISYYSDVIFGHYQMYQNYGSPNQTLVYTSQKNIGASTTQLWNTIIVSKSENSNKLSGTINDVVGTNQNPNFPQGVVGFLSMSINPNTSPQTAQWKVTPSTGMLAENQPTQFTIPTNVVLTKM